MGVSVIAKGKRGKSSVFAGHKQRTTGGLTKDKLTRNKNGKIVSKAASAQGKKLWVKNGLKAWADAVRAARKDLKCKGFVAIGGKTPAGKALYAKAKALLKRAFLGRSLAQTVDRRGPMSARRRRALTRVS